MSSQHHHSDSLGHQPQEPVHHHNHNPTSPTSPTRAYFPPSKTVPASIPQALSASLVASLASKKAAYINHPSIQKVIASHTITKQQEANAPDYDETIANIPDLDLLPPPPVYDIVNCSTSQTLLLVSSLINTILAVNDRLACPKITLFHSRAIPNISIEAYLSRILQYAPFQNEVLLIILLYFDRIGGGCKPTQVLTNTIPKSLLRQASLSSEEISQLTAPKTEATTPGDYFRNADEKAKQGRGGSGLTTSDADSDILDEEEPIADEIYTSSSESPVGSKLIINSFNIHRLLITSILVACKFSSDVFYPNVRYARVRQKVHGLPLIMPSIHPSFHPITLHRPSTYINHPHPHPLSTCTDKLWSSRLIIFLISCVHLLGRWSPTVRAQPARTRVPLPLPIRAQHNRIGTPDIREQAPHVPPTAQRDRTSRLRRHNPRQG